MLMSVSRIVSMAVIEMPDALIPLEITTAAATLAMREVDSTAQVKKLCSVLHVALSESSMLFLCTATFLFHSSRYQ